MYDFVLIYIDDFIVYQFKLPHLNLTLTATSWFYIICQLIFYGSDKFSQKSRHWFLPSRILVSQILQKQKIGSVRRINEKNLSIPQTY